MSFRGFIGTVGGNFSSSGDANYVASSYNSTGSNKNSMANTHLLKPPLIPKHLFNSSPLSLAIKSKMEGVNDIRQNGDFFGAGGRGEKSKEEDYESRSGSENMEAASGDDHDAPGGNPFKRKKYHRHTVGQIQELENSFKENPHPDEKTRLELSRKLNLGIKQVKFWFQNRRTQMKTQIERHENSILKQENDNLRIENIAMKEAMENPVCGNCGSPAALGEISIDGHHLRIENARLRDDLNRLRLLTNKFFSISQSSLSNSTSPENSDLEHAVERNGFGGLTSLGTSLSTGFDINSRVTSALPLLGNPRNMGMTSVDGTVDKFVFLELALTAMGELVKLAQIDSPLWYKSFDGYGETMNIEEYISTFPSCFGNKAHDFVTEATRASGTVIINSMDLIETLMDSNCWAEMFSSLIGTNSTTNMIMSGVEGSRNGALQVMQAEFQLLSPLVPVRQTKFLRYCKQYADGVWVVVDVSVDSGAEGAFASCRRLPSGCIVQDMPNGYSKVIWIEHMEYDERDVHQYFKTLLRSGMGFGAQKWVATLERQCECLAVMLSTVPGGDHSVIGVSGRRSIAKLTQRMTRSFCAGVCATMHEWEIVQAGNTKDAKLMIRRSVSNPSEPSGVILSATITVLMPVSHQLLFNFLLNEQTRNQWDVLAQDGPVKKMLHIAKGQDPGNHISLLRASADNGNPGGMLMLQEACSDVSGSTIVYAAVDISAMNVVMSGGDSSCVALLPSGFSIAPYFVPDTSRPSTSAMGDVGSIGSGSNCLLTVGFQILVNSKPSAKLNMESMDTLNTLISRTVEAIKANLECSWLGRAKMKET